MHPVLIFRHSATEGPGYFASFLDRHAIPWQLVRVDAGDPVPEHLNSVSGLCLMGGPMSVNDDLPWIPRELELIRQAVAAGTPVIGHCLGGQLMAKALGGSVGANPVKEIGWGELMVTDPDAARPWLGDVDAPLPGFHWHGETFTLPEGARRILKSAWCENQAYVLDDRHIGMQCHVEMTPELVASWCENGAAEIAASTSPAVQQPAAMLADVDTRTDQLHTLADKIYSRWIQGLSR
ncbi:MAG: glutamine amidotransferase [Hydrogenophilales bacterium 16-64-46]|nr:MAG: glutamine amidotransferase [Hydrogenophilales bacterium 12-64-13]OYZ05015.1 MAG: glutamine amidotransferase [Hydrogenophilales bacterium 16-64-46]OZA36766.1 MAG: glutamine amidotransferase [Hydrogenophilales bacterium 17-64-34]HQT00082.1 type 1 glutamine amidotransferase [Thiobacillus sp.]